jgi:hypothetical protein
MKHVLLTLLTALACTGITAQTTCNLSVGSVGPAGGLIFFDKGTNSDGWRFLEAAPGDIGAVSWGCFGILTTVTSYAIGTGEQNTINIAALCGPNNAAQLCLDYNFNGYTDWFLPSFDELTTMFSNLWANGLGNFNALNGQYWSSSDFSAEGAKIVSVNPASGASIPNFLVGDNNKNFSDYIRPIRKVSSNCSGFDDIQNVPQAISYQAVARDAQGAALSNASVQVQFTLLADSLTGATEYVETHVLTTNSLGLFTTAFGEGTAVSGTFAGINWTTGNKYLNVQIDTGNGWVDIGTQQLLSVPYSMHSATAGSIKNPGLPIYPDNAAAIAGGLNVGQIYRTAMGDLKIVY